MPWVGLALLLFCFLQVANAAPEVKQGILHPKGLLWKIEKPGYLTSYLYGTMHVSHSQVTTLSVPVEQAFLQAKHFVMEVLMSVEASGYIASVSYFNDGRTLKSVMGRVGYQRLTSLLDKRILLPEAVINNMKPWAVLMLLMLPPDQLSQGAVALDMLLYRRASQRKMLVSGLETAQEQISIFDSMRMSDQIWMLNRAVEEIDVTDALFPEMLKAYVARDLARLMDIQNALKSEDSDIDDRFMYELLDKRNARMAKRITPILKQGRAFIAIGALHLPGKGGVLDLLERQGYKVTAIY